jgi:hypothetical protein
MRLIVNTIFVIVSQYLIFETEVMLDVSIGFRV